MSDPTDNDFGEGQAANDEGAPAKEDAQGAEIAKLKDQLLRALAEGENIRKRGERAALDAAQYGVARFARDLLSVADNLKRALDAVPEAARNDDLAKALIAGVEAIEKELKTIFERHGIKAIEPKGERFNPNLHQAIAEVPGEGQAPGTVVSVAQTGYMLGDRLLRPAMVTVARAENAPSGSGVDTTA